MVEYYTLYTDKLESEYKETFQKIEAYCLMENVDTNSFNEQMMHLLDIFMNAQAKNRPVKSVVGNNLELFCKNFCSGFEVKHRLFEIVDYGKRMAWLILFFTLLDLTLEEGIRFWEIKTSIGGWITGAVISVIVSLIFGMFAQKLMFRIKKFSAGFYIVVEIVICIAIFMLLFGITDLENMYCPAWTVLLSCIVYLVIYHICNRKRKEKIQKVKFSDTIAAQMPQGLMDRYEKQNKRRIKRGKNPYTEAEYIQKTKTWLEREKKWLVFYAVLPVLIMLVFQIFMEFENFNERCIFAVLMLAVTYLCMLPFALLERKTLPAQLEWIRKCEEAGNVFVKETEESEESSWIG